MTNAKRAWVRALSILAGLVGAPALWFAQMLVSETISSNACYPLGIARASPRWPHVVAVLGTIAGVAFVLALVCAACAGLALRGVQRARSANHADAAAAADSGPSSTRFLAQCGVFAGTGFVVGLVFTGIAAGFVGPCSPWR